jgi:acyl-CoA synthetase (AMP-forming)/AMP-acid ligase II/carbonic anhydrase/acetyltransferase-like protein (isoleucine patch superfamily)
MSRNIQQSRPQFGRPRISRSFSNSVRNVSISENNVDLMVSDHQEPLIAIELSSQSFPGSQIQPPSIAPLIASAQHLLQPNGSIVGRHVASTILPQFPSLMSAIPTSNRPALEAALTNTPANADVDCNGSHFEHYLQQQPAMTHSDIRSFCIETGRILHDHMKLGRGHRIAVVLPNGPELALAILAFSCFCSVVPLNALSAIQELEADFLRAAVDHVIGLHAHVQCENDGSSIQNTAANPAIRQLCSQLKIPFTGLVPDTTKAGLFTLQYSHNCSFSPPKCLHLRRLVAHSNFTSGNSTNVVSPSSFIQQQPSTASEADRSAGGGNFFHNRNIERQMQRIPSLEEEYTFWSQPNQHDDEVLVLFTSGTTGSKKLVPHTLGNVLVGTACIAVSWKLTPKDVNVNLMPLFHIGGILRQVYSPILSGGCVICCPAFDPVIFWNLLAQNKFTWYYASPTMHQVILSTGRAEGYVVDSFHSESSSGSRGKMQPLKKTSLRMIANAAGGLLPATARELRQAFFGAHILPSYGMTECMPITSPPSNYMLEKPGTSGVAVGPEIVIFDAVLQMPVSTGNEGMICVRGEPCFSGYGQMSGEEINPSQQSSFHHGGWFNTGDLGYMDSDGYLYITGRSKEVINRGGEIISPMEVEEAVMGHPAVLACVAFSASHSVLQEVVGLLLVPAPNQPHVDLPALHEYLGEGRLAAPKWPQCLVYCDALPKSFTNKLLRVRLGKRLTLPELNDSMYWIERTFRATCPPQGTEVSVAIPCERVAVSATAVQKQLREAMQLLEEDELIVVPHETRIGALVAYLSSRLDRLLAVKIARRSLHGYLVPSHVCVCSTGSNPMTLLLSDQLLPPQPSDAISSILQEEKAKGRGPADPLVMELQDLMQNLLDLDCLPAPDTNFFNLGGSSMLASQFASKIRKQHGVQFSGAEVFHASTCNAIAAVIRARRGEVGTGESGSESAKQASHASSMGASELGSFNIDVSKFRFDAARLDSQSSFLGLLVQLAPLLVIYPFWQLTRLFLFFRTLLSILQSVPGERNLLKFLLTLVVFHTLWVTITPLVFVFVKWLLIGKYRQGRYPIWGEYYIRWWFVDILRKLIGRGSWGAHPQALNLFYRLLGAKIGKGARISTKAEIAEFDLVTIGENAAVDLCTMRGFGVDNGCMILGTVEVGNFSSVGVRSVIAPFTSVPDGVHLAPLSSSYEVVSGAEKNEQHWRYNRQALKEPNIWSNLLVIGPITFFVDTFSHVPAFLVLYWMLTTHWQYSEPFKTAGDLIEWLANPKRVPFYIGIRITRAVVAPLFYMIAAIFVKWCVIGKFKPGPRNTLSEWQLVRHSLAGTLFSREKIQDVTDLIGRHYELVSVLYRMLGAKVGKRVFWPGRQPVFTGEFDLLEIGDDVVFGSRSTLICTTVDSCEKIVLCAGSNVSDNTVVLPGCTLGKGAVLGSNSLCPEGRYLPESSVWLGVRSGSPILLEKGVEEFNGPLMAADVSLDKIQMNGDESTIRPFGKAFYRREANYFVLPLYAINTFTFLTRSALAALGALPILASLHLAAGYFYGWPIYNRSYNYVQVSSSSLYLILLSFFVVTHFFHVLVWLLVDITSKWAFMGRRKEGRYNYDTSSYAQRWELYQILTRVRDIGRMNFLDFIRGTPFMSTFFRSLGCSIGHDCCLYPAGFEPMMPEPDLVSMGNNCVIDCSSVVCHLNTRGNFELARIKMENNVTLRVGSRIQQAVVMESGSMLLEKSLALTGEVIEADSVWLGSPASRLITYDTSSIGTRPSGSYPGSNRGDGSIGGEFV